jgi:phage terminase large subunit
MATAAPATKPSPNPFHTLLASWAADPVAFVYQGLGMTPDDWQIDVLLALGRGERRISVRSGHGVGKSTLLAWCQLWFIITKYPSKTVCTAPTSGQLFDALWSELRAMINRLPEGVKDLLEVTSDRCVLKAAPAEAFISARTASKEKPEALAGVHSENVLLIADEASGIPEEIFQSAAGSMSGANATTIFTGNPTRLEGLFYRSHHELAEKWLTFRVSCLDCDRVDQDFVDDIAHRYGEESNQYRIRVLGEFPEAEDEKLIPANLIEEAVQRDIRPVAGMPRLWGVDPARFGSDRTAVIERHGPVLTGVHSLKNLDTMQIVGWVAHRYENTAYDERPEEICVDVIGLGAGVVDRLGELGLPVTSVNVAESSAYDPNAMRMRDELWLRARDWFQTRQCKIPDNRELIVDLMAPGFEYNSQGKIKVESKDAMRKRKVRSPDLADAFCLTFAARSGNVVSIEDFRTRQNRQKRAADGRAKRNSWVL